MKLYLCIMRNAFRSKLAYRTDTAFQTIQALIALAVQVFVWIALYRTGVVTDEITKSSQMSTMVSYTVVSNCISILVNNKVINWLETRIHSGDIAMDFVKPVNLKGYFFFNNLGEIFFKFLFSAVPIFWVSVVIFRIQLMNPRFAMVFLIAVSNSMFLNFSITYCIGMTGFWYPSLWHVDRVLWDLNRLLSGAFIPMWMFPDLLYQVSCFLPFKYMYYTPIQIYLGKLTFQNCLWQILIQLGWILLFHVISCLIFKAARRKLVVQGG